MKWLWSHRRWLLYAVTCACGAGFLAALWLRMPPAAGPAAGPASLARATGSLPGPAPPRLWAAPRRSLPHAYWQHRAAHPQRYRQPSCVSVPGPRHLEYAAPGWQRLRAHNHTNVYIYGAHWDDRFKEPVVRVLVYCDATPPPQLVCLLWYEEENAPDKVPARAAYAWRREWGGPKDTVNEPYILSCLARRHPPAPQRPPAAVTLVLEEHLCGSPTNILNVQGVPFTSGTTASGVKTTSSETVSPATSADLPPVPSAAVAGASDDASYERATAAAADVVTTTTPATLASAAPDPAATAPAPASTAPAATAPAATSRRTRSRRASTMSFCVCLKWLQFVDDVSASLVEWIEFIKEFGAIKLLVFIVQVHPNVERVLSYYSASGFADVTAFTHAPQLRTAFSASERHFHDYRRELLPLNDCLYRAHAQRCTWLVPIDSDEIIVPHDNYSSWHEVVAAETRGHTRVDALAHRNYYFVDSAQKELAAPPYMRIFGHRYRAGVPNPRGHNVKSFHSTSSVVSMHNHYPMSCNKGYCRNRDVAESVARLHHYRATCAGAGRQCRADTVRDDTLARYSHVVPRVLAVLRRLRLEPAAR